MQGKERTGLGFWFAHSRLFPLGAENWFLALTWPPIILFFFSLLQVFSLKILSISNFYCKYAAVHWERSRLAWLSAQIPNISDKLGRRRLGKVKRGRGCLLLPGTPPPMGRPPLPPLGTLLPPIGRLPGTGTLGRLDVWMGKLLVKVEAGGACNTIYNKMWVLWVLSLFTHSVTQGCNRFSTLQKTQQYSFAQKMIFNKM